MRQQRLVEVECIDDVIEQLKHVRDNYETEHDEQGMELATVKQQRDELLAALERIAVYQPAAMVSPDPRMRRLAAPNTTRIQVMVEIANEAIAKAKGGAA